MKKISLKFTMLSGLVLILLSFTIAGTGSIRGKITPADGASKVLAVLGTDTLSTLVNNGNFAFKNIKTGTYTILVKANTPYNDLSIKNVAVIDSATTDVGLLKLQ